MKQTTHRWQMLGGSAKDCLARAVRRNSRHELEYPRLPADTATAEEAQQAVEVAEGLIAAADTLLGQLSFFAQPERR
jgi:hypothetical protein